jgi:hypothetical protein
MQLTCTVKFGKGYIAHPFWVARSKLIDIQKGSGMNRVRSDSKRADSLKNYLQRIGMTMDEYHALEAEADRQFYQVRDLDGVALPKHAPDEIVIPAHQWNGALANACALATSGIRISKADQIRSILTVSDCYTSKVKADGVFERFVTVTSGTGAKLSNQRALRSNEYIANFRGDMTLTFSEDIVAADRVRKFWDFVGREIGVGAARKLGWGRFEVTWK